MLQERKCQYGKRYQGQHHHHVDVPWVRHRLRSWSQRYARIAAISTCSAAKVGVPSIPGHDGAFILPNVRFALAGSTGRRNAGIKSLGWGFE
jgi:hypothetical protein